MEWMKITKGPYRIFWQCQECKQTPFQDGPLGVEPKIEILCSFCGAQDVATVQGRFVYKREKRKWWFMPDKVLVSVEVKH